MRPAASWKARPTHCARLCLTPQVRRKRKFDASTPSADGELRIRLDTASLALERKHLGPIVRAYDGINALALLISERHPAAVRLAAARLPHGLARAPAHCGRQAATNTGDVRRTWCCARMSVGGE